jgi:hypothetical protein
LFFYFFLPNKILAQTNIKYNYDSILALQSPHKTICLFDLYFEARSKPAEIDKLNALVLTKGNATDRLVMAEMKERLAMPDSMGIGIKDLPLQEKYLIASKQLGDHYLIASHYYAISERYKSDGQHNKSFEYKLYCLDELKKDPSGKFYYQAGVLHNIATEYYEFKDYTTTITLGKTAFGLGGRYTANDLWFFKIDANIIGMAYLKKGEYDSASVWLQKTLDMAIEQKDTAWMGIAKGNLCSIKYFQKSYTEAIPSYQQAVAWCKSAHPQLWDNVVAFCSNMADSYLQTSNNNAAANMITEAMEANSKSVNLPGYIANQIKLYTVAETYNRRVGNAAKALQYIDSIKKYEGLLNSEFNITKKVQDEALLAYRNNELEKEVAFQKIKQEKTLLYSIIVASLLLGTSGLFYVKRQRLRLKLKQEKTEHEAYKVKEELKRSLAEMKLITSQVQEKNLLIEQFLQQIDLLKVQSSTITKEQMEQIEALKQKVILTENDWQHFKQLFEKVYPGYLSHLKTKYIHLTPAETRFLVFTKLELSSKEMCAMLGVGVEAIRNIRFRVKKKLGEDAMKEIGLAR